MADSIGIIGQVKNILSIDKSKSVNDKHKSEELKPAAPVDEVQISDQALDLVKASAAAKQASAQLSSSNATLSNDLDALNKLI